MALLLLPASFALGAATVLAVQRVLRKHGAPTAQKPGVTDTAPAPPAADKAVDCLRYVHPPHSAWKPGTKQPAPFAPGQDMLQFDPAVVEVASMYSLMISAVVPRPIAFVSSMAANGTFNLAPYSYFNIVRAALCEWCRCQGADIITGKLRTHTLHDSNTQQAAYQQNSRPFSKQRPVAVCAAR